MWARVKTALERFQRGHASYLYIRSLVHSLYEPAVLELVYSKLT